MKKCETCDFFMAKQIGHCYMFKVEPEGDCLRYQNEESKNKAGVKLDQGKPRLSLVLGGFSMALNEVGKVGTFGAQKYTDSGWVTVENGGERYSDAMLRHVLAEYSGESVDSESGLLHAAHAAWNALARLELELRKNSTDRSELVMTSKIIESLRATKS